MGSFYGPSISSDEIYHWKYKRKFKRNGRWVYIYDDGSMSESGTSSIKTRRRDYTDSEGDQHNESSYERISTDTNQLFTTHEEFGNKGSMGGNFHFETSEKITTYGKLHVMRMNTERKISDVVEKGGDLINKGRKSFSKFFSRFKR